MNFDISKINEQMKSIVNTYLDFDDDDQPKFTSESLSLFIENAIVDEKGKLHEKAMAFDKSIKDGKLDDSEIKNFLQSIGFDSVELGQIETPLGAGIPKSAINDAKVNNYDDDADGYLDAEEYAVYMEHKAAKPSDTTVVNPEVSEDLLAQDATEEPEVESPEVKAARERNEANQRALAEAQAKLKQNKERREALARERNAQKLAQLNENNKALEAQLAEMNRAIEQENAEIAALSQSTPVRGAAVGSEPAKSDDVKTEVVDEETVEQSGATGDDIDINWKTPAELDVHDRAEILKAIDNIMDQKQGCSPEELLVELKKSYKLEKYASFLQTMEGIVAKMSKYNSKSDVNKLRKDVRGNNVLPLFYSKVMDRMVKVARKNQIAKESKVIGDKYFAIKANKTKEGNDVNYTALRKQAVSETQGSISYGARARRQFETGEFRKDVSKAAVDNMYNDSTSETATRMTRSEENALHRAKVGYDRDYNLAVAREYDARGIYARDNRYKRRVKSEISHVSVDEIKRGLSVVTYTQGETHYGGATYKSSVLFAKIAKTNYMEDHKNDDGTIDLTEIAEICRYRVGSDVQCSRTNDTVNAELEHIRQELSKAFSKDLENTTLLTTKEAKQIMRFCAITMEPKERIVTGFVDKLRDLLIGAAAGSVGGVIGNSFVKAAPFSYEYLKKIAGEDYTKLIDLSKYSDHIEKGSYVKVVFHTADELRDILIDLDPELIRKLKEAALSSALTGALVGLLMSLMLDTIIGKNQPFERAVVNLQEKIKDMSLEEFQAYARSTYPGEIGATVAAFAEYFVEDGEFVLNDFLNELKENAGEGSNMNYRELLGMRLGIMDRKPEKGNVKFNDTSIYRFDKKKEEFVDVPQDPKPVPYKETEGLKVLVPGGVDWVKLADQYECLRKMNFKDKTRIMKIAQCLKGVDYSKDVIEPILTIVNNAYKESTPDKRFEKIASDLAAYDNIVDIPALIGLLRTGFLKEVRIPSELYGGCGPATDDLEVLKNNIKYVKKEGEKGMEMTNAQKGDARLLNQRGTGVVYVQPTTTVKTKRITYTCSVIINGKLTSRSGEDEAKVKAEIQNIIKAEEAKYLEANKGKTKDDFEKLITTIKTEAEFNSYIEKE